MLLYLFVLAMSLLNIAVLFAWGKPDWKPVFVAYLGLLLQGGCLLAVGALISAMTSNQIVAGGGGVFLGPLLFILSWVFQEDHTHAPTELKQHSLLPPHENFYKSNLHF